MSQQYTLYNILFEKAAPTKPDLQARLQAMKAGRQPATQPKSKIDTVRGLPTQELVKSGQQELKNKIEKLSKVADKLEPSESEVAQAKEAANTVSTDVTTISHILYPETSKEEPSKPAATKPVEEPSKSVSATAKTEPQNVATAPTLPQMPARTPAKTMEMSPEQLRGAMQAGGLPQTGPTAPTAAPGSATQTLPAARKSGFMNRLKGIFKETIEEIETNSKQLKP